VRIEFWLEFLGVPPRTELNQRRDAALSVSLDCGYPNEKDDAMQEIEIHTYARQLLEAHGSRAIAEAAQNAVELEAKGEMELAKTWRHIEDALKLMRGPHQS
jgi:hypothetical protein